MRWIGQHIWDLISRFRSDVYLESTSAGTIVSGGNLGLDSNNKIVKATVSSSGAVNDLSDASTSGVAANDILVWNGSSFVVESMTDLIANPTLYTFSTTSFNDGISGTQLIGSGSDWKAADAITFTAVYVAGPPDTSATIQKNVNGGGWSSMNSMDASAFTSGNNDAAVAYPSAKDQYIQFRVKVTNDGSAVDTAHTALYFRNNVFYGASASTSLDEAGVEGLSSEVTNLYTTNRSVNATSGKYLYIAFPATYADIHANGFKFNSITTPFESKATVNITNSAGYAEDYDVYRSTNHSLGNSTLQLSTSATLVNHIFCGTIVDSGSTRPNPSSVVFDSINQTIASNDITRTWSTVTASTNDWVMFAWPAASRVNSGNTPTFTVGVLSGGFTESSNSPQNYTNSSGYTESYRIFVSNQKNLGAITVITS